MRPALFAGAVAVVLVALGMFRVIENVQVMYSPPLSCQIFGGQWGLWSGWRCG